MTGMRNFKLKTSKGTLAASSGVLKHGTHVVVALLPNGKGDFKVYAETGPTVAVAKSRLLKRIDG